MNVAYGLNGIPDPKPDWMSTAMEDPYALQYAKIGDNWGSSKCKGGLVPFTPLDTTTDPRRKYCVNVNDPTYCKNVKIDNAKVDGVVPGALGTCAPNDCISGFVPYDGKCEKETGESRRPNKFKKHTSGNYNDKIGGQPGYAMIPINEVQPDYSCTQMCTNTGVSKSGKSFRSLLPSKWAGSYIYSAEPTAAFWNHSIDKIATNSDLWNEQIGTAYNAWFFKDQKPGVGRAGHGDRRGSKNQLAEAQYIYKCSTGKDPNCKQVPQLSQVELDDWKAFLMTKANCYCQGTSDPRYKYK